MTMTLNTVTFALFAFAFSFTGIAIERWTTTWPNTGPWPATLLATAFMCAAVVLVIRSQKADGP